ncbi:MAG: hypothetical protein EXS03_06545 [Phycisphaerales bacterium]|nr:hypothetical protein [Phycisphaerales bacterium]
MSPSILRSQPRAQCRLWIAELIGNLEWLVLKAKRVVCFELTPWGFLGKQLLLAAWQQSARASRQHRNHDYSGSAK